MPSRARRRRRCPAVGPAARRARAAAKKPITCRPTMTARAAPARRHSAGVSEPDSRANREPRAGNRRCGHRSFSPRIVASRRPARGALCAAIRPSQPAGSPRCDLATETSESARLSQPIRSKCVRCLPRLEQRARARLASAERASEGRAARGRHRRSGRALRRAGGATWSVELGAPAGQRGGQRCSCRQCGKAARSTACRRSASAPRAALDVHQPGLSPGRRAVDARAAAPRCRAAAGNLPSTDTRGWWGGRFVLALSRVSRWNANTSLDRRVDDDAALECARGLGVLQGRQLQ